MTALESISRVGVVAKRTSAGAVAAARELAKWLEAKGMAVELDADPSVPPDERPVPCDDCDLVIVLGGDGTLLSVARNVAAGTPILGVNLGRLGFLAEIGRDDLYEAVSEVLAGKYRIEERSMLDVGLHRKDGSVSQYQALNDAVIAKSALARIIEISLEIDGRPVATYRSDGLIVSTPTGSTAYNLSAGGPIIHPSLPVVVVTPICPHTLTLRPVVAPETSRIRLRLETPREEVYLTLDGQEGTMIEKGETVSIGPSEHKVRLVRTSEPTFYDSLRDKLRWGE